MARKLTAAQIRDRKTKRLAAGLSVVLIGVLAYQAPTILHLFNGSGGSGFPSAVSTTPPATAGGAPSVALPAVAGPLAAGQLTGFAAFASKDPFHAPATSAAASTVKPVATKATSSNVPAPAKKKAKVTPKPKPKPKSKPKAAIPLGAAPATVPAASPAAVPDAALIITNGKPQIVPIGGGFPRGQPLFKLVSLAVHKKSIRIAVLGGSFTNGLPTLLVKHGTVLTLANESDGLRYVIKLLRLTSAPTPGASGTSPVAAPAASASAG